MQILDLVSQTALAPLVDGNDLTLTIGNDRGVFINRLLDHFLFHVGFEDKHKFIVSHLTSPPPFGLTAPLSVLQRKQKARSRDTT